MEKFWLLVVQYRDPRHGWFVMEYEDEELVNHIYKGFVDRHGASMCALIAKER